MLKFVDHIRRISLIKGFVVVSGIFLVYLSFVFILNFLLNINKDEIKGFFRKFGVKLDFSKIKVSYSLNIYVKDLNLSVGDFSFYSKNLNLGLDLRKAILGKLQVRYVYVYDGNVVVPIRSDSQISNEVDYEALVARFLNYSDNLVFDIRNLKLSYVNISDGVTNDLSFKKLNVKVLNGDVVLFDIFSSLGFSLKNSDSLAKADLLVTGIGKFVDGKLSKISGKVLFENLEVFGIKLRDVSIAFFGSSRRIVGTGLSDYYQIDFEFLRDGTFRLNANISGLIESNTLITNTFYPIYKNTELGFVINDILKDSTLKVVISNNGFTDFELKSSNTYVVYRNFNKSEALSFIYTNSIRNLRIRKIDDTFVVSGYKLKAFNNNVTFSAYLKFGNGNIKLSRGDLYVNGVYFGFLRGIDVFTNRIVVSNNYLSGTLDFANLTGSFRLRDIFVASLLRIFNVNLPFSLDGFVDLKVFSNYVSMNLDFSSLAGNVVIKSNEIKVNNFNFASYGLVLDGKGSITNGGFAFELLAKLKSNDRVETIPVNLSLVSNKLRILGKDKIFVDGDIEKEIFDVSLYNLSFGGIEVRSLSFVSSLKDRKIKGKVDMSFQGFNFKSSIGGNLDNVKLDGYLYSESKSLKVSGGISLSGSEILGDFKVDNSTFVISLGKDNKVSVNAQINRLYVPNLLGIPTKTISGSVFLVLSLTETNVIDSIVYARGYLVSYLNGLFYKSDFSFSVDDTKVSVFGNLYNYFNVVNVKLNLPKVSGDVVFLAQIFPRLKVRRQFTNYIGFNGILNNGELSGRLFTRIIDFSGLNEVWDRNLRWVGKSIELFGDGDGLNVSFSGDTLNLSYVRGRNVIYSASGVKNRDSGDFEVRLQGVIPLEFLLIPDFITKVKGLRLVLNDFRVIISDKNDFKLFGKAKVLGDSLKIELSKDEFRDISGSVVANGKDIGFDNLSIKSGSSTVYLLGVLNINNISNPFLNLVITNRGYINGFLDMGYLKIEGKANFVVKLSGFSDNPYISGVVNFLEGSKAYYFFTTYSQPIVEDEAITPNFAQILNFDNFSMNFDRNLYFKSEIIEGYTKAPYSVQIKGSVFKNTLSLVGDFLLEEGTLNYLGRIFNISEVKIVFTGKEMDFVPYVIGEFFRYSFDSSRNEQVKIIMKTSGRATSLNPTFYSEPELPISEIARILGFPITSTNVVREGLELLEAIGVYDFVSYTMKSYTGLDIFSIKSPFVSSYLFSVIDRNYSLSYIDMIRGTEISIGKSIFPWLMVGYKLGFEYIGSSSTEGQFVPLHSFSLGWSYRNLLLEFEYSSFASENKKIEYEPKVELKFNRRF
jgi:hypothetical protein